MTSDTPDPWDSASEELKEVGRSEAAGLQELIVRTGTRVRRYTLRDGLSIGRAADRDVTLEGDYLVRPHHGIFKRAGSEWELAPPPKEDHGQERMQLGGEGGRTFVGSAALAIGNRTTNIPQKSPSVAPAVADGGQGEGGSPGSAPKWIAEESWIYGWSFPALLFVSVLIVFWGAATDPTPGEERSVNPIVLGIKCLLGFASLKVLLPSLIVPFRAVGYLVHNFRASRGGTVARVGIPFSPARGLEIFSGGSAILVTGLLIISCAGAFSSSGDGTPRQTVGTPQPKPPYTPATRTSPSVESDFASPTRSETSPRTVPPAAAPPLREAVTVAADGTGDFTNIQEAVNACRDGGEVTVMPGQYEGEVRLGRRVTLEGEGSRGDIVLETAFGNTLTLSGSAIARNLTILQRADPAEKLPLRFSAVLIDSGTPTLEQVTCSSVAGACIAVRGTGTAPSLTRCRAENSRDAGLYITDGAAGAYTYCDFIEGLKFGVGVIGDCAPTFDGCVASNTESAGWFLSEGATGTYSGCIARSCGGAGFAVAGSGTRPTVNSLLVESGADVGLLVSGGAGGTYSELRLRRNAAGILVTDPGSAPVVTGAATSPRTSTGLTVSGGAGGEFTRVRVKGAKLAGISVIGDGTNPTLTDCSATGGADAGLLAKDGAGGTCQDCEFTQNRVGVSAEGEKTTTAITDCRMTDNEQYGIAAFAVGPEVTVTGCDLRKNKLGPWGFADGASPTRSGNLEE